MNNLRPGWHVGYTRPQHEKKVARLLTEEKINLYLPTIKTVREWHDRKRYIDAPLFPSYIFIYLNNTEEYFKSLRSEGLLHFIRTGKDIARISDKIISDVKEIVGYGKNIEVSSDEFRPGQQLVIRQGALTGLRCEIVEFNGRQKIIVRVALLKRNILVALPSSHVMITSS